MKYNTVQWLAYDRNCMFIGSFDDKDCALDWAEKHNGYIDKHTIEHDESRIYDNLLRKDEREKCKVKYEKKIARLTAENTELRARMDKTVELPCAIGETVYTVIKNCAHCQHYHASWAECRAPATANFDCESTHGTCFTQDVIEDECKKHLCVAELKFDLGLLDPKTGKLLPYYFTDREVAEARLKELQGGEI